MELTQKVKNIQEKWDANFMKTYALAKVAAIQFSRLCPPGKLSSSS